ncbi:MAG TPA: hypothetical protein VE669_10075 [Actinomycetota bacterium]|jgi:hypothetical protein|nr:hypothetical protein [Actinomycetota bacterium]
MPSAVRRIKRLVITGTVITAMVTASAARADAPLHFGPFTNAYSFIGFTCGGSDILIEGEGTDSFTVFLDDTGEMTRVIYRARYPHDTLTNTVSGASIVVRGEFQEFIERIPRTDDFTKTIVGFRYLVNEPGAGVTIRDVGRITYGDLEQTVVLWQAGDHDLALESAFVPTFCDALA